MTASAFIGTDSHNRLDRWRGQRWVNRSLPFEFLTHSFSVTSAPFSQNENIWLRPFHSFPFFSNPAVSRVLLIRLL